MSSAASFLNVSRVDVSSTAVALSVATCARSDSSMSIRARCVFWPWVSREYQVSETSRHAHVSRGSHELREDSRGVGRGNRK